MNRQVHELWCTAPPLNHSTNKLSYLKHTNLQGEQRQRLPRPRHPSPQIGCSSIATMMMSLSSLLLEPAVTATYLIFKI